MPPPIGRRTLLAAALGGIAAAALAACGGDDDQRSDGTLSLSSGTLPPDGPHIVLRPPRTGDGPLVAMVGDSITVGSTDGLEAAADQLGIDLVINAQVGRRITVGRNPEAGVDAVNDVLEEVGEPDLWVIALGTNDVAKYATIDEYAGQIKALLDLIPSTAPLVWIDVYLRDYPDDSAKFNRALTDTLTSRGTTSIGAWTDYALGEGMLSDGIHPTDEGSVKFVDVVTSQIEAWLD